MNKVTKEELNKYNEIICKNCGSEYATLGINPFAAEINGNYTECYMCADCRYQSRMDI